MFITFLLIPFSLFIIVIGWYLQEKWKFRSLRHIPSAPVYPLVGSALEFGLNPVQKLKDLTRLLDTNGPVIQFSIGPFSHFMALTDPEIIEFFLSSPRYIKKSADYELLHPWLGNGLLTSFGSHWQKHRKVITPTFHFKILEDFIPTFNSEGEILIKRLNERADGNSFDIYPYISAYSLDLICETAMGTSVKAQNNTDNEYMNAVQFISKVFINRTFSAWKQFDLLFRFASEYEEHEKCLNIVHKFTRDVIKDKRSKLSMTTDNDAQYDDFGIKKRKVFLDLLLNATIDGKPLPDDDIAEEVDTFMFEGHDTTSSAISFALFAISKHPHIQKKIVGELNEVFCDDKEPTLYELNNLKYLEAVIKETLRLYPTVPYFARVLNEDATYKGVLYPKGLSIMFFVYYMHRRPEIYENPMVFNPDRFLLENNGNKTKNSFSYLPFSAGPRNCIGQKFAMYEIKSCLSKICRNFEILPKDDDFDVILSAETIMKSANGVQIRLKKRNSK